MHDEPPGLQDVASYPLYDAMVGRRARRFSMGATIPAGELQYLSDEKPRR